MAPTSDTTTVLKSLWLPSLRSHRAPLGTPSVLRQAEAGPPRNATSRGAACPQGGNAVVKSCKRKQPAKGGIVMYMYLHADVHMTEWVYMCL